MRQCWVIPNGRGEPWVIDTDETKPVYLKNGIPTYKDGEMFNYHLANEPPGEERCHDGNRLNLDIDNLERLSRSELVRLNQDGLRGDEAMNRSAIALAKLKAKLGEVKNREAK